MTQERGLSGTRRRLLAAAERLVLRDGGASLTIEAVAREAGVSKGGLLYHFPSKRALISGMVEHMAVDRFERELDSRRGGGSEAPGGWVRAYVEATFEPEDEERNLALQSGLLAAAANDPSLLTPVRERYEAFQSRAENDGIDPAVATVARLAADGLWFLELLGLPAVSGELRERVVGVLRDMTRNPEEEPPG